MLVFIHTLKFNRYLGVELFVNAQFWISRKNKTKENNKRKKKKHTKPTKLI